MHRDCQFLHEILCFAMPAGNVVNEARVVEFVKLRSAVSLFSKKKRMCATISTGTYSHLVSGSI